MNRTQKTVEIAESDAWKLYLLLEEMNRFLHQPENYPSARELGEWLDGGVYEQLRVAYYDVAGRWFDVDDETGCVIGPDGELHGGS